MLRDDVDILSWLDEEEAVKPNAVHQRISAPTLTAEDYNGTCFEIQREVLLAVMEKAIGVVPSRDIIPVLNNFQFTVEQDRLTVVGSSIKNSISVTTQQITTKVPGVEVFPARTLMNIVKECGAGSIVYVEVTASGAVVASGGFSVEIALASGKDFPKTDRLDDVAFHEVDRANFVSAIATVKYALPNKDFSGQDSMKIISIKGGKFTACDGSRFQQTRIDGFKLSMQLPTDSISALMKILSGSDQERLAIGETKNKLVFKIDNVVFYLNKMTDPYPNVEQLWLRPALNNDQSFKVNRAELLTAIKQVKVAADSDNNAVGLIIDATQVKIVAKDTNNSASTVIGCTWAGKQKVVVVNYTHLAEMLRAYPGDECNFLLGEDTKLNKFPLLLKHDDTQALATVSQMLAYRVGLV